MQRYIAPLFGAFAVLVVMSADSIAANLTTDSTRLTLAPTEKHGELVIHNSGKTKTAMRTAVTRWTQRDGKNEYEPTQDVLVSPTTFEIEPGGAQVVRVAVKAGETIRERSYRLFLQEILTKDTPAQDKGITLLRLGIPIFVTPEHAVHKLEWTLKPTTDGKLAVDVFNNGTVHSQIIDLRILDEHGHIVSDEKVFSYVLPGQEHFWEVPANADLKHKQMVHLDVVTDAQDERGKFELNPATPPAK